MKWKNTNVNEVRTLLKCVLHSSCMSISLAMKIQFISLAMETQFISLAVKIQFISLAVKTQFISDQFHDSCGFHFIQFSPSFSTFFLSHFSNILPSPSPPIRVGRRIWWDPDHLKLCYILFFLVSFVQTHYFMTLHTQLAKLREEREKRKRRYIRERKRRDIKMINFLRERKRKAHHLFSSFPSHSSLWTVPSFSCFNLLSLSSFFSISFFSLSFLSLLLSTIEVTHLLLI